MKMFFRISVALAVAACVAGCAGPMRTTPPAAVVTPLKTKVVPADRAADAITIGKSTRSDVIAALGETLVISFESGFEVWVYRIASGRAARSAAVQGSAPDSPEKKTGPEAGEFVVLFAPSGVVARTRIRPPSYADTQLRP